MIDTKEKQAREYATRSLKRQLDFQSVKIETAADILAATIETR